MKTTISTNGLNKNITQHFDLSIFSLASILLFIFVLFIPNPAASAETINSLDTNTENLYPPSPDAVTDKPINWLEIIRKNVPPLTNDRGSRWPMIMWDCVGFAPLSAENIEMLRQRGLTQHIRLNESMIPTAKALMAAKSPVIIVEFKGGVWPYNLAGDKSNWAHQYPEGMKVPEWWKKRPSPPLFSGWSKAADNIRLTMGKFKKAGITVDAAWLDYEGEPVMANYRAALYASSSRKFIPSKALESEPEFNRYRRQLWIQLLSSYVAAPLREIYPAISVTNWVATLSSPERPVKGWYSANHPPLGATLFTASTPVAYGIDIFFLDSWKKEYPLDREHVDRFFMHLLLRQVSDDAFNRAKTAPYLDSFPWVARWVQEHKNKKTPVMSRESYREALRHLWLRGIDSMQIFNPRKQGRQMRIYEIQDAVAIYDEMLAFRTLLEEGKPMNLEYLGVQEVGIIWSGLKNNNKAVVRLFNQGPQDGLLSFNPWPSQKITILAPKQGATYLLDYDRKNNSVAITTVSNSQ
jgi:hypothetical protein